MENQTNTTTNKTKKNTALWVTIIALLLVIIGILIWLLLLKFGTGNKPNMGQLMSQINQITEMDDADKQAAVNKLVAENEINISYETRPVFTDNISTNFRVVNIPNNHFPIVFILFDENDNVIYESDQIAPGYEVVGISLETPLEKGVHNGSIQIGYYNEGNVLSKFPIYMTFN